MAFNPAPTDGQDHCGRNGCPNGQTCFLYSGGTTCQPFNPPTTYPATGADASVVSPPSWYLFGSYPSVRYTGSLQNQTLNAACTTIPVPPNQLYFSLVDFIVKNDLGGFYTPQLDEQFSSTLVQYRGNCAENFYCQPTVPVNTTKSDYSTGQASVAGQLPGTCQPVRAPGAPCLSSTMCAGWHVSSDGSYDNNQYRCGPTTPPPANFSTSPSGICLDINAGKGNVNTNYPSGVQRTARTYLLSTLLLFCLIFLYLWYRRMKIRQRQQAMQAEYGGEPFDNTLVYASRGGVNRQPDENDNGELPAYGNHRRDERVTGPAAEEIGMYSFRTNNIVAPPPLSPPPPAGAYPPPSTADGPVQHNYSFPMSHPSLTNNVFSSPPAGNGLYAPPPSSPPPLHQTAEEARAAAIAAAAAAAVATPRPTSATPVDESTSNLQAGGLLPPSYDSTVPEGSRRGLNGDEKDQYPFESREDTGSSSPYKDEDSKEQLPASSSSSTHGSGSGSSSSGVPPPSSDTPKEH
ncbi:hypothetical protein EMPS_05038 [Entomortierella parvispora]|uniref:Uncharacterized protein n=1 Tax=Entomortierella parvispora TaxID=205924 RepID=A0A9P3H9Z0_9FUNG|nr:hypothetical protein EMPS_05038 [Entomortierella parvispora]